MINIKNNVLKELGTCANTVNKNKNASDKAKSFNKILDKSINNKKNENLKGCTTNKQNFTDSVSEGNELDEDKKLSKKNIKDIIEIILSMLNQDDNSKVSQEDKADFFQSNINEITDIINVIESVDIKNPSSLEDMQSKVQDIINKMAKKNITNQGPIIEDTITQDTITQVTKDVSNKVKDYLSFIRNDSENINESQQNISKDDISNSNKQKEVDNIQHLINKIRDNTNKNPEENNKFLNDDNNSKKEVFNSNNSRQVENKESSFLESLVNDDANSEDIQLDKINFHINKMQNLDKIENNISKNNISNNSNITKENFEFDIVKSIKLMNLNNMKELTLKVVPRELGEVIIRVSMDNGVLKANITSNTKEGYELLQSNSKIILEKLQSESIRVQEFSVDIYDQNSTTSNEHNFKDRQEEYRDGSNKNTKSINGITLEEENEESQSVVDDVINMLA